MSATSHYIPAEYYVKFQNRGGGLLGYAIPYEVNEHGESAQFKLSEARVDQWASMDVGLRIVNELREGFSIGNVITRWRTSNKVWRVEDPAGFELEIPSENLELLLTQCTLVKGVIQEPCIWARASSGGYNWLLPEGTKLYEDAQAYAERRATKVKLRDLKRGDTVLMKDGQTWVYLGGLYQTSWDTVSEGLVGSYSRTASTEVACTGHRRRYLFADSLKPGARVFSHGSPHISGRVTEVEEELSVEQVLALYDAGTCSTTEHRYVDRKIQDGKLELVQVDSSELGSPRPYEKSRREDRPAYYWDSWWSYPTLVIHDTTTDRYYVAGTGCGGYYYGARYFFSSYASNARFYVREIAKPDGSNTFRFVFQSRTERRGWHGERHYYVDTEVDFTQRFLNADYEGLEFYKVKLVGNKREVVV